MKKLLEFITTEITGNKDIKIEESEEGELQIFTIRAPQEVMGLLIGKEGKTIRAIRSLARARAIIDNLKMAVKLEEAV